MKKALAGALMAAAALAGCSSWNSKAARMRNPAPCPPAVVLADAARIVEFDGDQSLENVAYSGEIVKVELVCRYFDDRPIDASLKVKLALGIGPKGAERVRDFRYFVAVTRKDLEVIEKAEFGVRADFKDGESLAIVDDSVARIMIPRANKDISGTNFEVVVGFALTPQQAIFNRSGKSLKFPEAK